MKLITTIASITLTSCGSLQKDPSVVIGPQGATGEQGPSGSPGKTGKTGPQGSTGASGVDGTNGADGVDGKVGAPGPQGVVGANGRDGAAGPQGSQGPAGVDGRDGQDGKAGKDAPVILPIYPCGKKDGVVQEVLFEYNGQVFASFSDSVSGQNTRLAALPDGTFMTTDGTDCVFTITGGHVDVLQ